MVLQVWWAWARLGEMGSGTASFGRQGLVSRVLLSRCKSGQGKAGYGAAGEVCCYESG